MVKEKKKTTTKKKAKATTQRTDGSIRASREATKKLNKIAQRIWDKRQTECKAAGYFRPSAKLAIDYLVICDQAGEGYLSMDEREKDNAYLKMIKDYKAGA